MVARSSDTCCCTTRSLWLRIATSSKSMVCRWPRLIRDTALADGSLTRRRGRLSGGGRGNCHYVCCPRTSSLDGFTSPAGSLSRESLRASSSSREKSSMTFRWHGTWADRATGGTCTRRSPPPRLGVEHHRDGRKCPSEWSSVRVCRIVAQVFERDAQLRAEEDLLASEVKILFDHLGDAQITQCLLSSLHRGDRGILPRRGARADEFNDLIHAHGASLVGTLLQIFAGSESAD